MMLSRKIAKWEEYRPEPTWFAVLECGHRVPGTYDSDEGMSVSDKARYETLGELDCYECGRLEADIARKEAELSALKAGRKP